jgi:hypothetical protein
LQTTAAEAAPALKLKALTPIRMAFVMAFMKVSMSTSEAKVTLGWLNSF